MQLSTLTFTQPNYNLSSNSSLNLIGGIGETFFFLAPDWLKPHSTAIRLECPVSVCSKEDSTAYTVENGELVCESSETELHTCNFTFVNKVTDFNIEFMPVTAILCLVCPAGELLSS